MRRFLSATAFLVMLAVVLVAAGCGQRFDASADGAPAPGDLAGDSLAALEAKGSAHFVADMKTTLDGYSEQAPFYVHAEGDASASALDVDGTVGVGGLSVSGHALADAHHLFVRFMGEWYGEDQGLADAFKNAQKTYNGVSPWGDWATPEGLRKNFGELFAGKVSTGPVTDGVETWEFEGRLNTDGLLRLGRRYGEPMPPELAEKLGAASHLLLIVGRDDHLPRRIAFSVKLSPQDLKDLSNDGAANFESSLVLSDFGKPVEIHAPATVKPLDALFEQLFSGFE
jgi:hypothetical protein